MSLTDQGTTEETYFSPPPLDMRSHKTLRKAPYAVALGVNGGRWAAGTRMAANDSDDD